MNLALIFSLILWMAIPSNGDNSSLFKKVSRSMSTSLDINSLHSLLERSTTTLLIAVGGTTQEQSDWWRTGTSTPRFVVAPNAPSWKHFCSGQWTQERLPDAILLMINTHSDTAKSGEASGAMLKGKGEPNVHRNTSSSLDVIRNASFLFSNESSEAMKVTSSSSKTNNRSDDVPYSNFNNFMDSFSEILSENVKKKISSKSLLDTLKEKTATSLYLNHSTTVRKEKSNLPRLNQSQMFRRSTKYISLKHNAPSSHSFVHRKRSSSSLSNEENLVMKSRLSPTERDETMATRAAQGDKEEEMANKQKIDQKRIVSSELRWQTSEWEMLVSNRSKLERSDHMRLERQIVEQDMSEQGRAERKCSEQERTERLKVQQGYIERNVLSISSTRHRLFRLLSALRSSLVWNADALFLAVLPNPSEALAAQRALSRAEAFKAVALSLDESLGTPTLPTKFQILALQPARRPERPPTPIYATQLPHFKVHLRGRAVVLVVYTHTPFEEAQCGEGHFEWGFVFLVQTALLTARGAGLRPLCYSQANTIVGARGPDGVRTGLSQALVSGRGDALFLAVGGDPAGDPELSFLYPHGAEHACVYVRAAGPQPFLQVVYDVRSGSAAFAADESRARALLSRKARAVRTEPALYAAVGRVTRVAHEAIVLTDFPASFYLPHRLFSDGDGRPRLHRVAECVVSNIPVAFAARRRSPFLSALDASQRRATEGGLLLHVASLTARATRRQYDILPPPPPGAPRPPPYALRLDHVAGALALWAAGSGIAAAAFAAEWASAWAARRRRLYADTVH